MSQFNFQLFSYKTLKINPSRARKDTDESTSFNQNEDIFVILTYMYMYNNAQKDCTKKNEHSFFSLELKLKISRTKSFLNNQAKAKRNFTTEKQQGYKDFFIMIG